MTTNKYSVIRITLTAIIMLFLSHLPCIAQYNENVIKAAYIERITRFVEWPAKDSSLSREQFVIGVYDENEFYHTLIEVFKEKTIKERKVKIIQINSPEQITGCNICYLSENAKSLISKFMVTANSSGVLLVSAAKGFCSAGVHINFYIEDEKLKFELNEKSMGSTGFKVSYLLMQNIRIIK